MAPQAHKMASNPPNFFQYLEQPQQGGWIIRVSCTAPVLAHPCLDPLLSGCLYSRVLRRIRTRAILSARAFLFILIYFALRARGAFAVYRRRALTRV